MSKEVEDILSESEGSEGWDDVNEGDDEVESPEIISLFDDKVFPDATSMLNYCKEKFNFDFVATRDRLGLDFYGSIKLVNFGKSPNFFFFFFLGGVGRRCLTVFCSAQCGEGWQDSARADRRGRYPGRPLPDACTA